MHETDVARPSQTAATRVRSSSARRVSPPPNVVGQSPTAIGHASTGRQLCRRRRFLLPASSLTAISPRPRHPFPDLYPSPDPPTRCPVQGRWIGHSPISHRSSRRTTVRRPTRSPVLLLLSPGASGRSGLACTILLWLPSTQVHASAFVWGWGGAGSFLSSPRLFLSVFWRQEARVGSTENGCSTAVVYPPTARVLMSVWYLVFFGRGGSWGAPSVVCCRTLSQTFIVSCGIAHFGCTFGWCMNHDLPLRGAGNMKFCKRSRSAVGIVLRYVCCAARPVFMDHLSCVTSSYVVCRASCIACCVLSTVSYVMCCV